jgi:CelD/BcsL family acetyltransferase involved in cellulose biosynthesis
MSLSEQEAFQKDATPGVAKENRPGPSKADLFTVYSDFASVEHIWRRFEETADCYAFQRFDFLNTWHKHIGSLSDTEVQIVVVWGTNAKPKMILPLGIEKSARLRKLVWLGNHVSDYNAPLLAEDFSEKMGTQSFLELWTEIQTVLSSHDLVEMERQPELVENQANPFMSLRVSVNPSGAHMTVMGDDYSVYFNEKRNSRTKQQYRNRRKKLRAQGETIYVHPETKEEIVASVSKLVELKGDAFRAMGISNFLENPGYTEFYKDLAVQSGADGLAHVSHLEVGGSYAAGSWGLVHKGRFYYLLASYDGPRYGRLAPGTQALVYLMRWACERGISTFDFTIGDESYKSAWCEKSIELFDHRKAVTLRGSVATNFTNLLKSGKRFIKQSPTLWPLVLKYRAKLLAR